MVKQRKIKALENEEAEKFFEEIFKEKQMEENPPEPGLMISGKEDTKKCLKKQKLC